jgi:hypothetical protein
MTSNLKSRTNTGTSSAARHGPARTIAHAATFVVFLAIGVALIRVFEFATEGLVI